MARKSDFDPRRVLEIPLGDGDRVRFRLGHILVPPGRRISLRRDYDPDFTGGLRDKTGALERVAANVERLSQLQEKLYAQDTYALLVVFQALDAAGKDGAIRHVISGVDPQGVQVTSFKAPSVEELDHDYLWRVAKALPPRGMIGIFNRSHYEEVLVVRVHPEFLERQRLPPESLGPRLWTRRFKEINAFEKYLRRNGIVVLKFFLNVSKEEQRKRFLQRIEQPNKNWKFSLADYRERALWDDYQAAYEDMLRHTSTEWAPWFVIPADNKWFTRLAVSEALCLTLERLHLRFPRLDEQHRAELQKIKRALERER
jgi:PPK2 family polyphosphate:nucleotide phosphotransferase